MPAGCAVRYRFLLGDAASAFADADIAERSTARSCRRHRHGPCTRATAAALAVRFHWVGAGAFLSGAPPARDGADATFESTDAGLDGRAVLGVRLLAHTNARR